MVIIVDVVVVVFVVVVDNVDMIHNDDNVLLAEIVSKIM